MMTLADVPEMLDDWRAGELFKDEVYDLCLGLLARHEVPGDRQELRCRAVERLGQRREVVCVAPAGEELLGKMLRHAPLLAARRRGVTGKAGASARAGAAARASS